MMKINRNTINADISFWYSKTRLDCGKIMHEDWLNKQLLRLESQRVLLRKELDSDLNLQERLQVGKLILDLDTKITNLLVKIQTSGQLINDESVQFINDWMEQHHHTDRYMTYGSLIMVPIKARQKIIKILKNR